MKRNEAFDSIAKLYDEVRPSYPDKLVQDIIDNTKITKGDALLEIGAGTGKATMKLAKYGFKIKCIELSSNMAEFLKAKCELCPEVEIFVDSFESWEPRSNEKFKMIYCAQAFHWLDPSLSYKKCHRLLEDGGYLALFWYQPVEEESELKQEINKIISKYEKSSAEEEKKEHTIAELTELRKAEIESSGFFKEVKIFHYALENSMNAEEYIKVINSYSGFAVLEESIRLNLNKEVQDAINRYGGYITSNLNYSLFLGKKI